MKICLIQNWQLITWLLFIDFRHDDAVKAYEVVKDSAERQKHKDDQPTSPDFPPEVCSKINNCHVP